MIGLAWLVMAYREALRRSECNCYWCIYPVTRALKNRFK
jgi:hypothetical protein